MAHLRHRGEAPERQLRKNRDAAETSAWFFRAGVCFSLLRGRQSILSRIENDFRNDPEQSETIQTQIPRRYVSLLTSLMANLSRQFQNTTQRDSSLSFFLFLFSM
jgi:hypothetical protein